MEAIKKKGTFQPGNPGKPKGAVNKITGDLRSRITDFLSGEFESIKEDFKKLDPKDKIKFFVDLIQYSVPKLQAVQLESEFDKLTDEQLQQIIDELLKRKAA